MSSEPTHLLFVCSGNICRSPMAHVMAEWYAEKRGRRVDVKSAGTLGIEDRAADPHAIDVCEELGLDLTNHRSQGVTDALVAWADWILVMELHHSQELRERFPDSAGKTYMLGTFGGMLQIVDPIGQGRFRFRKTRDEIRRCVEVFVDRLPPPRV